MRPLLYAIFSHLNTSNGPAYRLHFHAYSPVAGLGRCSGTDKEFKNHMMRWPMFYNDPLNILDSKPLTRMPPKPSIENLQSKEKNVSVENLKCLIRKQKEYICLSLIGSLIPTLPLK